MDVERPQLTVSMLDDKQDQYRLSATYMPTGKSRFPTTPSCYEFQPYFESPMVDPDYTPPSPVDTQESMTEHDNLEYDELTPPLPARDSLSSLAAEDLSSPNPSDSSASKPSFSSVSIKPDPLPPHSNPQVLSETQSQAFSGSDRLPPLRFGNDEVVNSGTEEVEYKILRGHAPTSSLHSDKPFLTVSSPSNGCTVGSIRFHKMISSKIELTINEQQTALSHAGVVHRRWGFQSTTNKHETCNWTQDNSTGGAMLEDSKKHGHVIARMKGDMLHFDKARPSPEAYDEIVISAIAMAEAARRHQRTSEIADIAGAIGDFTSAGHSGSSAGGGGGLHGG